MDSGGRNQGGGVVPFVSRGEVEREAARDLPLPELWRLWWLGPGAAMRNKNSRKNYTRCEQLSRTLADYPRPENIEEWAARLVDAVGLGVRTADMHRYILQGVYTWARDRGLAGANPVAASRRTVPPPAESHPIRNIAEVWPVLLAVARDATEAAFLGTLRFAGLRPEEAPALLPEDVLRRTSPWELSVTKQRTSRDSFQTKPPKGSRQRGSRRIPVRPELAALLAPVLDAWHPVQLRIGTRSAVRSTADVRFLFPYRGRELEDLRARLGAVAPDHFGPGHGLHTFRHTCAFELYEGGAQVVTISEWLGHESVLTTEKYLARMVGGKVRADPALAQFFAPPSSAQSCSTLPPPAAPARPRTDKVIRRELRADAAVCGCSHLSLDHAGGPCGRCACESFEAVKRDRRRSRAAGPPSVDSCSPGVEHEPTGGAGKGPPHQSPTRVRTVTLRSVCQPSGKADV